MAAVFLLANPQTIPAPAQEVVLGDEQFGEYLPLLDDKRIALFSNHTGIVGDENSGLGGVGDADPTLIPFGTNSAGEEITYGRHILDALLEKDVDITAVFSPEHGFRGTGDAGADVENSVDEKTGVPILSLYSGNSRYPAQEDLDRFDTLVVDIQDVGLRYYTYYISMYYLMDACAANGKEVIILDRPNPNGFYDGESYDISKTFFHDLDTIDDLTGLQEYKRIQIGGKPRKKP